MTANVRRVVTGHDKDGQAVIKIDEIVHNINRRGPSQSAALIWTSDKIPADNADAADAGAVPDGPVGRQGSLFRINTYEPGASSRNHRTHSLDHAVVLSGEIELSLDGASVRLKAGDCLVQRGTIHHWLNHGPDKCVIAFFLVGAEPVEIADRLPEATA